MTDPDGKLPAVFIDAHHHFIDTTSEIYADFLRSVASDLIYTSTGPILIAVNPFQPMTSLYSHEMMERYRAHGEGSLGSGDDGGGGARTPLQGRRGGGGGGGASSASASSASGSASGSDGRSGDASTGA